MRDTFPDRRAPWLESKAGVIVAALVSLIATPAASADPIAYTISRGAVSSLHLARLDLETLEVQLIAPVDFSPSALTLHPDGTLYGAAWVAGEHVLLSYDAGTGETTVVGSIDPDLERFTFMGLTAGSAGVLWVSVTDDTGGYPGRPVLFSIDRETAALGTLLELPELPPLLRGLAADGETLIVQSEGGLFQIDPASGDASPILPATVLADWDLDIDAAGVLYGGVLQPVLGTVLVNFFRFDPKTGEGGQIGNATFLGGLAFDRSASGAPQAIPTLSPLALVILAVSLTWSAIWLRRRRPTGVTRP